MASLVCFFIDFLIQCNREWPCNHCQRRKVADKCRFNVPAPDQGDTRGSVENKKRHADGGLVQPPETSELEGPVENLGYMAAEMLARLGITDQVCRNVGHPKFRSIQLTRTFNWCDLE